MMSAAGRVQPTGGVTQPHPGTIAPPLDWSRLYSSLFVVSPVSLSVSRGIETITGVTRVSQCVMMVRRSVTVIGITAVWMTNTQGITTSVRAPVLARNKAL